jgi:hypothetical protein
VKLRKPSILMVSSVSPLSFFFPRRINCCYINFHCSYLYSYYNSSRTLCIKCWDSAFSTEFQHFILRFPYFADTTKRGVRGWKTGWLYRFLYCNAWNHPKKNSHVSWVVMFCVKKSYFSVFIKKLCWNLANFIIKIRRIYNVKPNFFFARKEKKHCHILL